jgi:adenosylmethionine-8-amino-7-oxononanoate aminotransferase
MDRRTQQPFPAEGSEITYLLAKLAELGLLTRADSNLYLAPPLCIERHEIDQLIGIVETALSCFEEAHSYL